MGFFAETSKKPCNIWQVSLAIVNYSIFTVQ